MNAARVAAIGAALAVAAAGVAQAPHGAGAALPPDWEQRDLEGKWVAYRAQVDASADRPRTTAAWVQLLGRHRELDLLEWIAIYEGWQHAGVELARLEAPHVLRVAVWNLTGFDSHGNDGAAKALRARAPALLRWLELHPNAATGPVAALRDQLVGDGHGPAASVDALPPLDAMQLLVPLLDAPASLAELGGRTTAEPRVRYVHQVMRALGGVLANGHADELVVAKVVALTRHGHATLRYHAFDTLAKMPPHHVPFDALAAISRDATADADRRRLATLAVSSSSHPALLDLLLELAVAEHHPAADTALTRLGEVGDPVAVAPLRALAATGDARGRAFATALSRVDQRAGEKVFTAGTGLRALLQRCAWLEVRRDPRAPDVRAATLALLRAAPAGQLRAGLEHWSAATVPSALRDGTADAVDAAARAIVRELLDGSRTK